MKKTTKAVREAVNAFKIKHNMKANIEKESIQETECDLTVDKKAKEAIKNMKELSKRFSDLTINAEAITVMNLLSNEMYYLLNAKSVC